MLFAIYVAAAAVAVVFVSVQAERDARRDAERDAAHAASTGAQQLAQGVELLRTTVGQLAANPQVAQTFAQPEACTLAFGGGDALTRGHLDIIRVDGTVACSSRPESRGESYAGTSWLARARRQPLFLAPARDAATDRQVVLATAPIPGRGVVAAFADLAPVGPGLASLYGGGRPTEFLVASADGRRVIARSIAPGRWIGRPLASSGFASHAGAGEASDLDGTARLYGSATVDGAGWRFYVGEEQDAALAAGERLRDRQLLIILIGLGVVMAASFLIYRRVAAPMRRLGEAVRSRSVAGDPVPVSGPTEVAALGDDVNQLISSVARELRERERAEENYRLLFEQSPLPMCICDVETHRILAVNDAAVSAYGYAREELGALTLAELAEPGEHSVLSELLADPRSFERLGPFRHVKKDGSGLDVRITSHTATFQGRPARFLLLEDVGERERFERRLRQSQRLESLGQLAGGIAHDFNNVLGVIMGFASFAKDRVARAADPGDAGGRREVTESLEQIDQAGQRAARLTRQLLAFARQETVEPTVLDVGEVVAGMQPMLRQAAGGRTRLSVTLAEGVWPIEIDRGQLEQVLLNLVVNARDAMPEGGELTIDVENTTVDSDYAAGRPGVGQGRYVRLRVSDTGAGMDEATIQRAFEPFFTTKPAGSGTGLGLATVYGIVTQAGGRAQIYSEPGHGTTFTALFPVVAATAVALPTPDLAGTEGDETILVVEDDASMREVAERLLTGRGYRVLTAADGADAVEVASQHPGGIDLLVTDVVLPRLLGREVAARIGELEPGIRVLYVSGYAPSLVGALGPLDPGVRVIGKPFSEAELLGGVREALGERAQAADLGAAASGT